MFGRATIRLGIGPHSSFNCYDESGGLLNVTGSDVRCKSSNISETVQDRDVVIRNTNKCRFFSVTLESVITR